MIGDGSGAHGNEQKSGQSLHFSFSSVLKPKIALFFVVASSAHGLDAKATAEVPWFLSVTFRDGDATGPCVNRRPFGTGGSRSGRFKPQTV